MKPDTKAVKWEVACLLMDLGKAAEEGNPITGQVTFNPDAVDATSLRAVAQEIYKGAI